MARSWPPRLLLAATLAAFACEGEDTSTLEVAVRVEPPAQAPSFPAQVLVAFDSSGSGFVVFRVGFLCGPDAPFSTTVTFASPRHGDGATTVEAFLVPAARGSPFQCGPLVAPEPVALPPGSAGVSRTSASLVAVGGCGSGDVRAATVVIGRE